MFRIFCVALLVAVVAVTAAPIMMGGMDPHDRAVELVGKMTLEEKVTLLHGVDGPYVGNVPGIPRLGIPAIKMNDGPQGFRMDKGYYPKTTTAFPSGLNIAATFDIAAAALWGDTMGKEFRAKGANIQLGPGMNVARVPRNGRNFEYLSGEDPFLGRMLVKPVIEGIQKNRVIANAKHYINNNEESNRMNVSENVDERTEWEIYLQPFAGAVEAGVLSVMCAYNRINQDWACENDETLNKELKGRLGFRGWVMSDWGATHSTKKAALAGLDQQMPDDSFFGAALIDAVKKGDVAETVVDDKVTRILAAMYEVGLFDHPETGDLSVNVTCDEHNRIARDLAARSSVLLKNEHSLLPLDEDHIKSIAVLGSPAQDTAIVAGDGSGHVDPPYIVTGLEGITKRAGSNIKVSYHPTAPQADAVKAAAAADVSVVFVATDSSEGSDRPNLSLPKDQDDLVFAVAKVSKKVIVVVTTPGAVLMPWSDKVSGILTVFMPGQEAGNAIADILFGDFNPSARLPLTMPNVENEIGFTVQQYPGLPADNPLQADYSEKLEVGYRWYHAHKVTPKFCFGHGLSYSAFKYSDFNPPKAGANPYVRGMSLMLTNVGEYTGTEIVQMYLTFPDEVNEPPRQLKGVQVVTLDPSKSQLVAFYLTNDIMSIWDVTVHDWRVVHGQFKIEIGSSSCDIHLETSLYL